MSETVPAEPTTSTMSHENASTTMVRIAVATFESVVRIPHLARMAVSPEKSADPAANASHILVTSVYGSHYSDLPGPGRGGAFDLHGEQGDCPQHFSVRRFVP